MMIRSRHVALVLAAALLASGSAAYAQRPTTPAADPPAGSTYVCPHPTSAAHDQYGCMPKPGGGAARAQVNNPIDPRKLR